MKSLAKRLASRYSLLCAVALAGLALLSGCAPAQTDQDTNAQAQDAATKAAAVPRVLILEPEDEAQMPGESVLINLSTENIEIAPAGDTRPGTGHHHLFLDVPVTPAGEPIPVGQPGIIHLGQAQTSYEFKGLAPGSYTVIAAVGDLAHRRIEPQVMDTVRFRVRLP